MQNFHKISDGLNVMDALRELADNAYAWGEITARQDLPGSPHVDTEAIFLRWSADKSVHAAFNDLDAIDYPALNVLNQCRVLLANAIRLIKPMQIGRVMIVNLLPGGKIRKHYDDGDYSDHYDRFHLCMYAENGNTFYVKESEDCIDSVDMHAGELYWFNHKKEHWAINRSSGNRIHMIIDAVAPAFRRLRDGI